MKAIKTVPSFWSLTLRYAIPWGIIFFVLMRGQYRISLVREVITDSLGALLFGMAMAAIQIRRERRRQ